MNKTKIRSRDIERPVENRLKIKRREAGLSQHALAIAVGASTQQIQKYEKEVHLVSSGKLCMFARLLKAPMEYFFNRTEDETYDSNDNHRS